MEAKEPISEREEIASEVVGVDLKKFWRTFRDLTVKPSETIASYCDGQRKSYIRPVTYFLASWGLSFTLTKASGLFDQSLNAGRQLARGDEKSINVAEDVIRIMKQSDPGLAAEEVERLTDSINGSFEFLLSQYGMLLLLLPIFLPLQWVFFKKYRNPFVHHLYFYLYASAQLNLLTLPALAIGYFMPAQATAIATLVTLPGIVYFYYVEYKFYPGLSVGQLIGRNTAALAISIIPLLVWFFVLWISAFFIILKMNM